MINDYYELAKPRMVFANVAVAAAAFVFGSSPQFEWHTFASMCAGLFGIIASACVYNNIADRALDRHMERTKKRALAEGRVGVAVAHFYAAILLGAGSALLYMYTPTPTLLFALLGFAFYVLLYTPLKPKTPYALYVGAVAGAVPPLVGYTAATHTLDWYALGLFVFMFAWQVPHFLAISRFRFDEYRAAGVPLFVSSPLTSDERVRARKKFKRSLVVLAVFCAGLIGAGLLF